MNSTQRCCRPRIPTRIRWLRLSRFWCLTVFPRLHRFLARELSVALQPLLGWWLGLKRWLSRLFERTRAPLFVLGWLLYLCFRLLIWARLLLRVFRIDVLVLITRIHLILVIVSFWLRENVVLKLWITGRLGQLTFLNICLLVQNMIGKSLTKVCFLIVGRHRKSIIWIGVIFLLVKILQVRVVLVEKRVWWTSVWVFHMYVASGTRSAEAWTERSAAWKLKWSVIGVVTIIVLWLHVVKFVLRRVD